MKSTIRLFKVILSFLFFGGLFPFYKLLFGSTSVLSIKDTLLKIINEKLSVCRFGDGEYRLIINKGLVLQKSNFQLSKQLIEVFSNNSEKLIVCIVDHTHFNQKKIEIKIHHMRCYVQMYHRYKHLLIKNYTYGDANITRFYMDMKNKSEAKVLFDLWKKVWDNKEIVIFEGDKTRFGLGNNLLDNAICVERVLCPSNNAHNYYNQIIYCARQFSKDKLLLFSLGATATLAASDLCKEGYRVIDVGHLDIEYEWYLSNASERKIIKNKQFTEVINPIPVGDPSDEKYYSQIIARIGV